MFLWLNYCVSVCVIGESLLLCCSCALAGRRLLGAGQAGIAAERTSSTGSSSELPWKPNCAVLGGEGELSLLQQPMEQRHPIRCVCITSLLLRVPMVAVPVFQGPSRQISITYMGEGERESERGRRESERGGVLVQKAKTRTTKKLHSWN